VRYLGFLVEILYLIILILAVFTETSYSTKWPRLEIFC